MNLGLTICVPGCIYIVAVHEYLPYAVILFAIDGRLYGRFSIFIGPATLRTALLLQWRRRSWECVRCGCIFRTSSTWWWYEILRLLKRIHEERRVFVITNWRVRIRINSNWIDFSGSVDYTCSTCITFFFFFSLYNHFQVLRSISWKMFEKQRDKMTYSQ